MPSLASMRSVDPAGDSMQPLGPPIRPQQGVTIPLPKPTGTPGVVQKPDGKLATDLPLPKPLVVHDSIVEVTRIKSNFIKAEAGDWVRTLSRQRIIDDINAMVDRVYQVQSADSSALRAGGWSFNHPCRRYPDGELWTEFAEPPL